MLPDLITTLENVHLTNDAIAGKHKPAALKLDLNGIVIHASNAFVKFMAMDKSMIEGEELSKITSMEHQAVDSLIHRVNKGSIVASEVVFQSIALKKYVNCIFMPSKTDDGKNVVDLQLNF